MDGFWTIFVYVSWAASATLLIASANSAARRARRAHARASTRRN